MAVSRSPTEVTRVHRARVTRDEPDWPSNVFVVLEHESSGKLRIGGHKILEHVIAEFAASRRTLTAGEPAQEPSSRGTGLDERIETLWASLSAFLVAGGYVVEEVDVADHRVTASFDLATGRAVGEVTDLVDGVDGGDLGKRVFASIASAFDRVVPELCALTSEALNTAGHDAAAASILEDKRTGLLSMVRNTAPLLMALAEIDPQRVGASRRLELVRLRVHLAFRQKAWELAQPDIEFLLAHDELLAGSERDQLRLALGNAAAARGFQETAFATWRSVAADTRSDTTNRAWAYKNLTTLLPPSDPAREVFADLAAGLFAAAGQRKAVAECRLIEAESVATRDPQRALAQLEHVCAGLDGSDPSSRLLRGGALFERALLERRLGRRELAYRHLVESADTLRGVLGAAGALQNALVMLEVTGGELGHDVEAVSRESDAIARELFGASYELRTRLNMLLQRFDVAEAATLGRLLSAPEHADLRRTLDVVRAMNDPTLNDAERIALMEGAAVHERLTHDRPLIALPGLADRLLVSGNEERALAVYREILAIDPFDRVARQNVAMLLMRLGRFDEAVSYFEQQRATWGDRPGILLGLGEALLGNGDASRAATIFASIMAIEGLAPDHLADAQRGFRKAQECGGIVQAAPRSAPLPVTVREWDDALAAFAAHMKAEARLHLWRTDKGRKKWVELPEKVAGQLLRTFLSGKLGGRMESFTELAAGAGRIDLFVILEGGLRMIVELKMLGAGYTTTYAFSGTDQIAHYMDNRDCHLGYLVLFDARVDTWGATPTAQASTTNDIRIVMIDARSHVK